MKPITITLSAVGMLIFSAMAGWNFAPYFLLRTEEKKLPKTTLDSKLSENGVIAALKANASDKRLERQMADGLIPDIAAMSVAEARSAMETLWSHWHPKNAYEEELANLLMERLGELDPFAAFQLGESHRWPWGNFAFFQGIVSSMVRSDPDRAEKALSAMPSTALKAEAFEAAAILMAEKDPNRAYLWARRECFDVGLFVRGLAENAPLKAAEILQKNPCLLSDSQVLDKISQTLWKTDPEAASEWAASLPPGSQARNTAMLNMAKSLAITDPPKAVSYILGAFGSSQTRQETLSEIFGQWTEKDPQAAAQAASELPAGPIREGIFLALSVKAAIAEPASIVSLQHQFVSTDSLSKFCSQVVSAMAPKQPRETASAVSSIEDTNIRESQLKRVGFFWANSSLPEMTHYAMQSPPAERDAIIEGAIAPVFWQGFDYAMRWVENFPPEIQHNLLTKAAQNEQIRLTDNQKKQLSKSIQK